MSWRAVVAWLELALYPQLRCLAPRERAAARARAEQEPFDLIEWGGILLGLVIGTALTRYSSAGVGALERLSMVMLNLAVAIPVLCVLVGPFLIRRTRRGLAKALQKRAEPS